MITEDEIGARGEGAGLNIFGACDLCEEVIDYLCLKRENEREKERENPGRLHKLLSGISTAWGTNMKLFYINLLQ